MKEKTCQPRILYPEKLSFRNKEEKNFHRQTPKIIQYHQTYLTRSAESSYGEKKKKTITSNMKIYGKYSTH